MRASNLLPLAALLCLSGNIVWAATPEGEPYESPDYSIMLTPVYTEVLVPAEPRYTTLEITTIDVGRPVIVDVSRRSAATNALHGNGYLVLWETDPPTIQVGEPFHLNMEMYDTEGNRPLQLVPGTSASLTLLQHRGNCALVLPLELNADGEVTNTHDLILPYSGGYTAVLRLQPDGFDTVEREVVFFVEGVAENGRDITAAPMGESGKVTTLPSFTQSVNRTVRNGANSGVTGYNPDGWMRVDEDLEARLDSTAEVDALLEQAHGPVLLVRRTDARANVGEGARVAE